MSDQHCTSKFNFCTYFSYVVQVVSSISILFVVVSTVGMTLNTMVYFQHQVIADTKLSLKTECALFGLMLITMGYL